MINALKEHILNWAKNEWSFIFWMTALNLTCIDNFAVDNHAGYRFAAILSLGLANVFLPAVLLDIVILLLFRYKRIRGGVKAFFLGVNVCLFTADMFTIFYYGVPLNSAMFEVMSTTNLREGSEFLSMYLFSGKLWAVLAATAGILLSLRYFLGMLAESRKGFYLLLLAGVILLAHSIHNTSFKRYNPQKEIGVFRLVSLLKKNYYDNAAMKEMAGGKHHEVVLTRNESSIPYVVFVLGESTTRNRMSLYDYDLPTNPHLAERLNEGGMYLFSDVVSPHSHTMLVLRKLFTFYRLGDKDNWFNYASLFSILKAAGYHTVWLSNQESAILGVTGKFFAGQCGTARFTLLRDHDGDGMIYDEKLLPLLDSELLLSSSFPKNFYVLHLMGTHMSYRYRYPVEFDRFHYSDEGGFDGINDSQRKVRAEYDNAVLYNDFIIDEIIKRFETRNAIVIYVSDHGEEVYEDRDFFGHEEDMGSCSMIEIPMIIWLSPKFRESFPALEQRIALSTSKPFMTDDMIHVILDIMSIETEDYRPELSVINNSFDAGRTRIYSGRRYTKSRLY